MSMDENAKKPKRAFGRSLKDFENLSEAENKLIDCTARGEVCVLGERVPEAPTPENLVRPELIRFLALGGDDDAPVHEKGVQLAAACIGGATGEEPRMLEFDGTKLEKQLRLFNCRFQAPPLFRDSQARSLVLVGSIFPGFIANRLKLDGSILLVNAKSTGEFRLTESEISGSLVCSGACFENKSGPAIICDGLTISGSVFFRSDVDKANDSHQIFQSTGEVRLLGAKIGGDLDCSGGYFFNDEERSLSCDGVNIGGSVFCNKGFNARGEVRFLGANIGHNLDCSGGDFHNEGAVAFSCEGASIGRDLILCFEFNESKLFYKPFYASGEVRLLGAAIGGDLSCFGGCFINKNGRAISCQGTKICGSVFIRKHPDAASNIPPFQAVGGVNLNGAVIGGDLDCCGGHFIDDDGSALICDGARIGGSLFFRKAAQANGKVSFAHAKAATLADDLSCWPDQSLDLDGFTYERIAASSPLDAKSRIAWLEKQQPKFLAGDSCALQPWIHLAKVLREQGHFREAAEVDIAREERLRAAGKIGDRRALLSWAEKWGQLDSEGHYVSFLQSLSEQITYVLHWFYGWFSGYGHRPVKIAYFAVAIWLVLASVYAIEDNYGHFTTANRSLTKTQFNPWAYSLDLILPVVQLGEFAKWTHVSDGSWLTLSGWTGAMIYFEKIFGWVAALTLAAIAAGLVKRKDG
jgi:hypothetical protein